MKQTRLMAAGGLALVALAWGAIPLIVREPVPSSQLVTARVWLGAAALLAFHGVTGSLRLPTAHRARVVAAGVILAGHWALFFLALKLTTVAVALAVLYLGPVIAAVAAGPILGERVGPWARGGLALGVVGIVLLVRPGEGATLAGVLVAAAAAASMAALLIVGKPAAEDLGGFELATWELVVASIVLIPWVPATVSGMGDFWWQYLVLGVALTGIVGVAYWSMMRHLPVSVTGVMMYLEPVAATVLAALVLSERLDGIGWLGILLVVGGGVLAAFEAAEMEVIGAPATL
jgi:drug/metabolite transporter (DMT)-like permease